MILFESGRRTPAKLQIILDDCCFTLLCYYISNYYMMPLVDAVVFLRLLSPSTEFLLFAILGSRETKGDIKIAETGAGRNEPNCYGRGIPKRTINECEKVTHLSSRQIPSLPPFWVYSKYFQNVTNFDIINMCYQIL